MQTSLQVALFMPILTSRVAQETGSQRLPSSLLASGQLLSDEPEPQLIQQHRGKGEKKAPKCSNQKMRDFEMDELSASVQLFVSAPVSVYVCVKMKEARELTRIILGHDRKLSS